MAGPVLNIRVKTDARDAEAGLGKVESRLDKFQGAVDRAAVPSGAALAGLTALGKKTVDYASQAEQALTGVEVVFKGSADTIIANSKKADQALGLSEASYNELAAVAGSALRSAFTDTDELASKTDELMHRGADLASVFGASTPEALEAMQAALRGQFDPLERFGVNLDMATVNARMAADGTDKLTGAAGAAAKQQAIYALIMEESAFAAGDFAKNQDTALGAQQRATATAENSAAALGEHLLPAYTALMVMLGQVAGFLADNSGATVALGVGIAALAATIIATSIALRVYQGALAAVKIAKLAAAGAQRVWNAAMRANPIGLIITGIALLIAGVVYAYNRFGWFKAFVDGVARGLLAGWRAASSGVQRAVTGAMDGGRRAVDRFRSGVGSAVSWVTSRWSAMTSRAQSTASAAMDGGRRAVDRFRSGVGSAVSWVTSRWSAMTSRVRSLIVTAIATVVTTVGRVRSAFSTAMAGARAAINTVLSPIRTLIGYIDRALDKLGPLRSLAGPLGSLFGSGWQRPAVASTIPDDGSPFYMTAAELAGGIRGYSFASSGGGAMLAGTVTNITVNGAIDPNATARAIKRVLGRDNVRDGGGSLWS